MIKIEELNVDQRRDLYASLPQDVDEITLEHFTIDDLHNAHLRKTIESTLKDIIAASPIFDAACLGRTCEIDFRDKDEEMPDIHPYPWSNKVDSDNDDVKTIRTKDGILKKFTLDFEGVVVECMMIFPSNYIFAKLDTVRNNLQEDTRRRLKSF